MIHITNHNKEVNLMGVSYYDSVPFMVTNYRPTSVGGVELFI